MNAQLAKSLMREYLNLADLHARAQEGSQDEDRRNLHRNMEEQARDRAIGWRQVADALLAQCLSISPMHEDTHIIDRLGGTSAVARLCEVEPPSVSEWRRKGIPRARRMYLMAVRPDVFSDADQPQADEAGPQEQAA